MNCLSTHPAALVLGLGLALAAGHPVQAAHPTPPHTVANLLNRAARPWLARRATTLHPDPTGRDWNVSDPGITVRPLTLPRLAGLATTVHLDPADPSWSPRSRTPRPSLRAITSRDTIAHPDPSGNPWGPHEGGIIAVHLAAHGGLVDLGMHPDPMGTPWGPVGAIRGGTTLRDLAAPARSVHTLGGWGRVALSGRHDLCWPFSVSGR